MAKVTIGTPNAPTAAEIRDQAMQHRLAGEEGGNVPLSAPEGAPAARQIGDITVRMLDETTKRMEVTDRLGRKLVAQPLSELERFELFEVFGSATPNAYTIGLSSLAATLRSVTTPDGKVSGRVFPKVMTHLKGAIAVLGGEGMDALRTAFGSLKDDETPDESEKEEDDGTIALAKN